MIVNFTLHNKKIYIHLHVLSKHIGGSFGDTMKDFFLQLKEKFTAPAVEEEEFVPESEDYVELGVSGSGSDDSKSKVLVRPYVMEDFEDIKGILDSLREGNTVALINIKPLKDKDIVELKRAVNKLRKTCTAIDGDIAGFGEDYIVAVPYFARIHRNVAFDDTE